MNSDNELPAEVVAEIHAGRKVAAIKKLRVMQGKSLKEAKALVDSYLRDHPATSVKQPPRAETGVGRIVLLAIGVGVIFAVYKYFVA